MTINKMKIDYAIISAMPEELEFFAKEFSDIKYTDVEIGEFSFRVYDYNHSKVLIAYSGIGTVFAANMMTLIYSCFNPEYYLISGTAGGIKNGLKLRDVVVAATAFEAEMHGLFSQVKNTPFESCLEHPMKHQHFPDCYSADPELLAICDSLSLDFHKGTVVSSNAFPAPKELFEEIKFLDPYSIDMETSAFYQIAWLLNLKVLAVRGISNILNTDGSDEKVHESDVRGSSQAAAAVLLAVLNKSISLKYQSKSDQKALHNDALELIKMYNLKPHPEGGYYARTYASADTVLPSDGERYNHETRNAGSAIYYLLNNNDFSSWHTMKSDELWHFYKGSPLNIHVIDKNGKFSTHLLGDPFKTPNAAFQVCVPAGNYFAAENVDKNSYSLIGCTVSPGFEFKDWKLSDRTELINFFPQHKEIIERFSRLSTDCLEDQDLQEKSRVRL